MNYKIILNEQKLKDFITFLPELQEDETFYVCLFARNKYIRGTEHEQFMKTDKCQLKRFTANKKNLFSKIKQLECEVGSYQIKDYPIPQESLALYVAINPRNQRKALFDLMESGLRLLKSNNKGFNLHAEAMSAIQHKSSARKVFTEFDFDFIDINDLDVSFLEKDSYEIVKTRGGFHLLVLPNLQKDRKWYTKITQQGKTDVKGDMLLPVVGCTQGGFMPHFI